MTTAQVAVTALSAAAIVWVLWYFLGARGRGVAAAVVGTEGAGSAAQDVRITVKGGYTPDTIVVQAGRPVRLRFYRDETADCSERVVFEHFGINQALPAFQATTIEFTPTEAGEFPFRCGMSMLKGLLVVEAPGDRRAAPSPHKFHA